MTNPFDLNNYKPQINASKMELARRNSHQASKAVNEVRKKGVELSRPISPRWHVEFGRSPKELTVAMPERSAKK